MRRSKTVPDFEEMVVEKPQKWKYTDDEGRKLTGAGLLLYDDEGIWVIKENVKGKKIYRDIGGKYNFEDGTIFRTIAREVAEETYGILELFSSDLQRLSTFYPLVYVNGHLGKPVYACLPLPYHIIGRKLRNEDFQKAREEIIYHNPDVPEEYYNSIKLEYLTFDRINALEVPLSLRLKRIIKYHPPLRKNVSQLVFFHK